MSGVIATIPKFQFSANGAPMVNGTLETYLAGTSTPATTWQDQALSIANTNPITLDSRGECVLWLDSTKAYKFILKNAGGVVQWTQDNVSGAASLHGLAASDGSAQIGYTPAGTGAVATNVQSKLREFVSVTDYGAVADGATDNTTAITTLFSNLGAAYTGVIKIPYGVKYNFNTVAPLAPVRATIIDESAVNGWDSAGFRQKIVGYWESGDATAVVDLNPVISSGHNAVQWLENRGTSGSGSGNARVAALGWSSGRFQQGQPGIRSLSKVEWKQSSFRPTLWDWQVRKYATWAARDYEIWAQGRSFTAGQYTITGGRTYVAASTGTAGATQPTHTAGTVSDGGVNWTYVETAQDRYVWGVDEHGRMSTNASTAGGYTYRFKQSSEDTESLLVAFEGTGASKTVSLRLNGTDAGGTQQTGPVLRGTTAGALQLLNGAGTITLFQADADSFDVGPLGRREVTAADGDTAPTVANCGALIVSNTGATSITTLSNGASTQEVMLIFTNGNTTLVHSTIFRLRGAVNVTPATSGTTPFPTIVMKKYTGSSAWFEVSRNF